jgi:hypothetical protein
VDLLLPADGGTTATRKATDFNTLSQMWAAQYGDINDPAVKEKIASTARALAGVGPSPFVPSHRKAQQPATIKRKMGPDT